MNINRYKSPFLKIAAREINRISERKTIYLLSIILPIVIFLFIALIYKNGVLRNLPVAIYDADNSEISRLIVRSIDATASMDVVESLQSVDEIKKEFQRGNIQGAVYIPKGLEADLKSGKSANAVLFKNTSNLIIGNTIYKDGLTVIRTISGGILLKKLRSKGMDYSAAVNLVNPIRTETLPLYNPNYNYENYITPGLLVALLQMIIMIAAVLIISSEFTHNTFPELQELAGNKVLLILFGKSLPHLFIHIATVLGLVGIIFPIFNISVTGSVFWTIILLIHFVISSFYVGILISCIFHEQLFATEVALFINTPAFIFSGFTFPLWGMPALHNYFAQVIPFTHFITGFMKIYEMGAPVKYLLPEIIKLSVFLFVSIIASLIVLKYQIRRYYSASSSGVLERL
jgi:ABC-2 type transport system permease protein